MRFFCPKCGTRQEKPDDEVLPEGMTVPCEKCGFKISIRQPKKKPTTDVSAGSITTREEISEEPPTQMKSPIEEPEEDDRGETEEPGPSSPKASEARISFYLGTGRSGEKYRFRDLIYALQAPLDYRKTLVVGIFVFGGSLLFAGLGYLGTLTRSSVGLTIGLVLGILFYWVATTLGLGISSQLVNLEMEAGKRMPLSEAIRFVKTRPLAVLGTPFVFFGGILVLGAALAVISLIGRIPYAGSIIYGLVFSATLVLAFTAVLVGILMSLVSFSYIPAMSSENLGAWACAKRMLSLLKRHLGTYLLHALVAGACALVLFVVLQFLFGLAVALIAWLGGNLMGPDFSSTLMAVPMGLFSALFFVLPAPVQAWFHASMGSDWHFQIGGWLTGLSLLAVVSLVLGFVLVYFYAAGVVNYRLLIQKDS